MIFLSTYLCEFFLYLTLIKKKIQRRDKLRKLLLGPSIYAHCSANMAVSKETLESRLVTLKDLGCSTDMTVEDLVSVCKLNTRKPTKNDRRIQRKIQTDKTCLETKPDWDKVVQKSKIVYNNKTYETLVIPVNTYVYRGFTYGDNPDYYTEEKKHEIIANNNRIYNNIKEKKAEAKFYGNLGVACFYAYDSVNKTWKHHLLEYETTKPIVLLDMSKWQNLKNIVDDIGNTNGDIFRETHNFDVNNSTQKLKRISFMDLDIKMTEIMKIWFNLQTSLKLNLSGFGHINMDGMHSEFVTFGSLNNLKLINEYSSDNLSVPELVNINDANNRISLINVSFNHHKGGRYGSPPEPFFVTDLLYYFDTQAQELNLPEEQYKQLLGKLIGSYKSRLKLPPKMTWKALFHDMIKEKKDINYLIRKGAIDP